MTAEQYKVTATELNLRSQPVTNATNRIAVLPQGHIVTRRAIAPDPSWWQITTQLNGNNLEGFVAHRFLELVPVQYQVTADSLNLRSQPLVNATNRIAILPQGQIVTRLAIAPDPSWWQVSTQLNGTPLQGFVAQQYLAPVAPSSGIDPLAAAKDRKKVFDDFLAIEVREGSNQGHLSFLDKGIDASPLKSDIAQFPDRLARKPDGVQVVSLGTNLNLAGSGRTVTFSSYPANGKLPTIDDIEATGFRLDPEITEFCVCVGSYADGELKTHWLGKNPLREAQFWSATKIVPIINVVCQANSRFPGVKVGDCSIAGSGKKLNFTEAAIDVVSYRNDDFANNVFVSNPVAAMFKRFESLPGLEQWWRNRTGNSELSFSGYYGFPPTIINPSLLSPTGQTLLTAKPEGTVGPNLVTAYDLTRIISMAGWHHYLPTDAKLPGAQWHSLAATVQAMGYDSARYVDVAIAKLGLAPSISSLVVLSKLGFGNDPQNQFRRHTEITYTALVQFIDNRPKAEGKPAKFRSISFTLRGMKQQLNASGVRDLNAEAIGLDARMAAEVTELLRRIVTEELA